MQSQQRRRDWGWQRWRIKKSRITRRGSRQDRQIGRQGRIRSGRAGAADQQAAAARRRRDVRDESSRRHGHDSQPGPDRGEHEEALPAKGDRPGSNGNAPHEHSPRRRTRPRQVSDRLRLSAPEKGRPPGDPNGLVEQVLGRSRSPCLSELAIAEPKTKNMATPAQGARSCPKRAVSWRSKRTTPTSCGRGGTSRGLWISSCDDLNAYDLLHQKQLILTQAGPRAAPRRAADTRPRRRKS